MHAKHLALLTLASLAFGVQDAQAQRMNLVEGRETLEFARGLASEFSFVGLAEEVLKLGESRGFPSSMDEQVALEKCNIFAIGARSERDPVKRHELFEQALVTYEDFIRENTRSDSLPDAESGFVQVSADYAQSLIVTIEEAVGEEAEKMRERRIEVLTAAVAKTGELVESLKTIQEPSEADKRRLYNLMLNRGRMLTETARSQEDPTFSFEQAALTLDELQSLAGEASPFGLRAFVALGDNMVARGNYLDAAYMYEYVVNTAIPAGPGEWKQIVDEQELTKADKEVRWLFLEIGTKGLVESYSSEGDQSSALGWALHYYNIQKQEGFTFSVGGYLSLLEVARALMEAGGYLGGRPGEQQWYPSEDAAKEAGHSSSRSSGATIEMSMITPGTARSRAWRPEC